MAHKGTSNIKQTKINMLVTQYEAFIMKEDKRIDEMLARFQTIINGLRNLGRIYENGDQVNKILGCNVKEIETQSHNHLRSK